jgi:hypothetical protein
MIQAADFPMLFVLQKVQMEMGVIQMGGESKMQQVRQLDDQKSIQIKLGVYETGIEKETNLVSSLGEAAMKLLWIDWCTSGPCSA